MEGSPVRPDDADCIAGEWGDAVRDSCRFAATSMFELGRDTKRRKTGRRRAANMASRPTVCQSPAAMTVTASAISPRTNQRSRGENSLSEAAGGATRFSDGGASRGIGFMEARSPAEWPRELKRKPSRTSWYLARCLSISKLLRPELLRWGSEICRVGPARFERRLTIEERRVIMVDRRGDAPLAPTYPQTGRGPWKGQRVASGTAIRTRSSEFASRAAVAIRLGSCRGRAWNRRGPGSEIRRLPPSRETCPSS